jgi:hypothetical protein
MTRKLLLRLHMYDILGKRMGPHTTTMKTLLMENSTHTHSTYLLPRDKVLSGRKSGNRCAIISEQQWTVIYTVIMNTIIFGLLEPLSSLYSSPCPSRQPLHTELTSQNVCTANLLPPTSHSDHSTTALRHPISCNITDNVILNAERSLPLPPST